MAPTGFFHGIRVSYVDTMPRSPRIVLSNVVFIVGTADRRLARTPAVFNDPVLCLTDKEDIDKFGPKLPGFTLGYSLDILRDYECGHVWVVDVFDPDIHKSPSGDTDYMADSNRKVQLKRATAGVSSDDNAHLPENLIVSDANGNVLVEDTDYTVDQLGLLTFLTTVQPGDTITASYDYPDPSLVTAADIIGTVVDGDRTGMQNALDVYEISNGERPKLLIAPWYSHIPAVAVELAAVTNKLGAMCSIDSPPGTRRDDAISGRNGLGPATSFNVSDRRVHLSTCQIENSDGVMIPFSVHWAGRRSLSDFERGFWQSWSNQPLRNAVSRQWRLTSDFTRADTDANVLNANGISVPAQMPGTGLISWGNRSSLYPGDRVPLSFECVSRNLDITLETAQLICRPFVGRPIIKPTIDMILGTLNGLVKAQIQNYALIQGSEFTYLKESNSPTNITDGLLVINYRFGMPTPAEQIFIEGTIDINLYANIAEDLVNAN